MVKLGIWTLLTWISVLKVFELGWVFHSKGKSVDLKLVGEVEKTNNPLWKSKTPKKQVSQSSGGKALLLGIWEVLSTSSLTFDQIHFSAEFVYLTYDEHIENKFNEL